MITIIKKYIVPLVVIWIFLNGFSLNIRGDNLKVDDNKGPLVTNNLYPFYLPYINLLPEGAEPLGAGRIRLIFSNNYANTFNLDVDGIADGKDFDMDLENLRFSVDFDIGISDRLDLGIETAYVYEYGGIFDSVIQGFHDLFGFSNAGRQKVENNLFNLKYENENGVWIDLHQPAGGLNNITFKAKLNIVNRKDKGFFLALQGAAKMPLGDENYLFSSGEWDFAATLLAEKTGYNYGFYINLGWMHLGKPQNLNIFDFTEDVFSYMICYEWLIRGGWSLYIQADGNGSPYVSGHKRLDDQSGTINLGFKYEIFNSVIIQVSFAEEFFTYATTDISLMTALIINI
jgi:hypothetical protein